MIKIWRKNYDNGGHGKCLKPFKDRNIKSAIIKSYGTSGTGTCKEE